MCPGWWPGDGTEGLPDADNSQTKIGEIVRALREESNMELGGQAATIHLSTVQSAIDRLESQEQTIAALTVRAEQAEKERDDAVVNINLCMNGDICKACVSWKNGICSRKDNRCDPKYRGLQQKNGEEK